MYGSGKQRRSELRGAQPELLQSVSIRNQTLQEGRPRLHIHPEQLDFV